ncbi:MAG: CoA pyrophosphatase [Acidimicrobiia bacterium]
MVDRGGAQRIPRPPGTRLGGPPPWAGFEIERESLGLVAVRSRLAVMAPALHVVEHYESREAAVLVALYDDAGETHVVLTKRPETMPSHQGEIAFPGGKREPGDATLAAAALREAREEVGLAADAVEVVAELDSISTVATAFTITPVVGLLAAKPVLRPDPVEVVAAFGVPLTELLETYREEMWDLWGEYRSMAFFELAGETVWGATARILTRLLTVLTTRPGPDPETDANRPLG